jgi:hypothetical protein
MVVHVCSISPSSDESKPEIHPDVAVILEDFAMVFEPPPSLPPERACDHVIPLVAGAKPVQIRQYRYPPPLRMRLRNKLLICCPRASFNPALVPLLHQFYWSERKMAPSVFVWTIGI